MVRSERNRRRSPAEVFTDIYLHNRWGGTPGEFYSGVGSRNEAVVAAYVASIRDMLEAPGCPPLPSDLTFVDLGCGDFRVGQQLLPMCARYVGVDIVEPLIERNRTCFGSEKASFVCSNIIDDPLPPGDVCFIRQVLQHLSNDQVARVLRKVSQYRLVVITEHHPDASDAVRPNLDKVHGGDIRAAKKSGIYLTEPPFSLPTDRVEQILDISGVGFGEEPIPGHIRTFVYRPTHLR